MLVVMYDKSAKIRVIKLQVGPTSCSGNVTVQKHKNARSAACRHVFDTHMYTYVHLHHLCPLATLLWRTSLKSSLATNLRCNSCHIAGMLPRQSSHKYSMTVIYEIHSQTHTHTHTSAEMYLNSVVPLCGNNFLIFTFRSSVDSEASPLICPTLFRISFAALPFTKRRI